MRPAAIKLLSEELSREPEFLARFEREAKSAAALNHPNVVQVYDYGQAEGQYFFVMELVDGTDLSIYVKEHGKLPIATALDYCEQAVKALKFAASHAIIHRDVKPANLMLTRDGLLKVSDLGLAKKLTDDSEVTMTGVGMGSPHFLAPEQADDAAHVDHRADIYALGVTLLYLLTGKRPFEGASNFSVVLAHANKPLPTGIELGTALAKCGSAVTVVEAADRLHARADRFAVHEHRARAAVPRVAADLRRGEPEVFAEHLGEAARARLDLDGRAVDAEPDAHRDRSAASRIARPTRVRAARMR